MTRRILGFAALTLGVAIEQGCSSADDARPFRGKPTTSSTAGVAIDAGEAQPVLEPELLPIMDSGVDVREKPVAVVERELPPGFSSEASGGWSVIGPLSEYEAPNDNVCTNVLRAVVRDFVQAHVDFGQRKPASWQEPGLYTSQVLYELDGERKPRINSARSPLDLIERFEDWYRNVPGVNVPYVVDLWLEPHATKQGFFIFDSDSFFPLDEHNTSPGDVQQGGSDNANHNFLFTVELHTAFEYRGGESFHFRGDDDVFVFVNGRLAVDIGGIHGPLTGGVDLDARAGELGISVGNVYTLDLFQAERNPVGSNFRIETSLDFRECGVLPVDVR
jgi:fibro-slime domain-containing protein